MCENCGRDWSKELKELAKQMKGRGKCAVTIVCAKCGHKQEVDLERVDSMGAKPSMKCGLCNKKLQPLDAHMGRIKGNLDVFHIDCWNEYWRDWKVKGVKK